MNNLHKNNGHFQKRIHKYDIFLNSVPALPCDFLRKGSGGMAMQVSLTQFTTFPLQLKVPNCYGRPSFPFRNRTEGRLSCTVQSHTTFPALMGCENPKVRPKNLQKGKETKSMFKNSKYGNKKT